MAVKGSSGGIPITKRMRERLVAARTVSQRDAAEKMGVSNVHLCNLENGNTRPSYDLLLRWARVVGCIVTLDVELK